MRQHRLVRALLASAVLLSGALPASSAVAAPPAAEVKPQFPGVYRYRLGDFQLTALSDGTVSQDLPALLMRTTPSEVNGLLSRSFLENPIEASINAFLIDTGSHLILADTGSGQIFAPTGGKLPSSLAAAGYRPEQITDILLTHIHADHSGGLVHDGHRVFPNATVHVGQPDIDFFLSPAPKGAGGYAARHFEEAAKTVGLYVSAGKVKPFSGRGEVLPGVTAVPTPGHTPGHSFYVIESRGQRIDLWGDLLHFAAVQLPKPSITIVYDVDPAAAAAQRAKQLATAAAQQRLVAGAHLPFPGIGHVRSEASGYSWVPVNYLNRDLP
jgi:glyoxylase-like metal-dependent hydrolase (beta-lactamase superfamily II)